MNENRAVDTIIKIWSKVSHRFACSEYRDALGRWDVEPKQEWLSQVAGMISESLTPYVTNWTFVERGSEASRGDTKLIIRPYVSIPKWRFIKRWRSYPTAWIDDAPPFEEGKTRPILFRAACELVLAAAFVLYPESLREANKLLDNRESAEYLARTLRRIDNRFGQEMYWEAYGNLRETFFTKFPSEALPSDTPMIKAIFYADPPRRDRKEQLEAADTIDRYMQKNNLPYIATRELDAWSRGQMGLVRHDPGGHLLTPLQAAQILPILRETDSDNTHFWNSPWGFAGGGENGELRWMKGSLWLYLQEFGAAYWVRDITYLDEIFFAMGGRKELTDDDSSDEADLVGWLMMLAILDSEKYLEEMKPLMGEYLHKRYLESADMCLFNLRMFERDFCEDGEGKPIS